MDMNPGWRQLSVQEPAELTKELRDYSILTRTGAKA
jgi:hypothetical protein